MKLASLSILLAAAVAAPSLAQTQAPQAQGPAVQGSQPQPNGAAVRNNRKKGAALRKWSLEKTPELKQEQQARVQGPDAPPPEVVKVPRQRTAQARPQEKKKPRVNAGQVLAPLLRKGRN